MYGVSEGLKVRKGPEKFTIVIGFLQINVSTSPGAHDLIHLTASEVSHKSLL